jgi:G:T/U-mismatch repair DNA glycosylase
MESTQFSVPEIHPFEFNYIPERATRLVIGSFPTTSDKMAFNFFYPNSNNKFWKILSLVFENSVTKLNLKVSKNDPEDLKIHNVHQRKEFCRENRFGLTDMIAKCYRFKGNSKDEFLLVNQYMPVLDFLEAHSTIRCIILTGNSPATSAHHHFYQYLVMNNKEFRLKAIGNIYEGELIIGKRKLKIMSLNSTSSRGTNRNEEHLIEQYRSAFSQS